jgi:hypothetical protein
MITEITLDQLQGDYDWSEVFGEGSGGNCNGTIQVIPPGALVDSSGVSRKKVVSILAAVNGENDGDQWVGLFLLDDGRYLVAEGGCDYTGWDCQAGNSLCVAGSLSDAIKYGLNPEQKKRLGIEFKDTRNPELHDFTWAVRQVREETGYTCRDCNPHRVLSKTQSGCLVTAAAGGGDDRQITIQDALAHDWRFHNNGE